MRPERRADDGKRERNDQDQAETDGDRGQRLPAEPQPAVAIGERLRGQEIGRLRLGAKGPGVVATGHRESVSPGTPTRNRRARATRRLTSRSPSASSRTERT